MAVKRIYEFTDYVFAMGFRLFLGLLLCALQEDVFIRTQTLSEFYLLLEETENPVNRKRL